MHSLYNEELKLCAGPMERVLELSEELAQKDAEMQEIEMQRGTTADDDSPSRGTAADENPTRGAAKRA